MARAFAGGKVSATTVERWAGCHFQYFLQDVLRLQATRRPEDEWTIAPRDRGTVMHLVLRRFYQALHDAGRLRNGDRIGTADHDLLDTIAAEELDELERQGATGHSLAWANARTAILVDLHETIEKDQGWRDDERLRPHLFEQTFGNPDDPESWPSVAVTLGDGRTLSFSGQIDRIDVARGSPPREALIIDYKTGGIGSHNEIRHDPLCGGRHIQLAVYTRALLSRLPQGGETWLVRAEYRFVTAKGEFKRLPIEGGPALDQRLDQVLQWVADGVGGGTFLAVPGARSRRTFANCTTCAYDRVCSPTRDETWERKQGGLTPLDEPTP
jgi:ATP-dependent helicase/DNAse subunit B